MDEFCTKSDALSFERLNGMPIASMCFGGGGGSGGGGGGGDMGQDDTLGEEDQAAATAGDFGPSSGFGLSQAEAAAQAHAANVAMANIANANAFVEDNYLYNQKSFLEKALNPAKALGFALGLGRPGRAALGAVQGSILGGVPGAVQGAVTSAMSNPTSSFSDVGPLGAPDPAGNTTGPSDDGGDGGGGDWDYQQAPSILNPVPGAAAPIAVAAAPQMPQYEFKRNWWEGNKFFPAPITRISS